MQKLSNQPPKGTADWFPEEFAVRKYIFDTWREVCLSYGYQEYLTPIIESAEIYRAKSGEDVGGKELTTFVDRGGRELAIRPEMTPSVTRMVTRNYNSSPKPIRVFSIANFFRNEKPQKGRKREFWQLNFDLFGAATPVADLEIILMSIEMMRSFGATKDQFVVYLNDRAWINLLVEEYLDFGDSKKVEVVRLMDKFEKMRIEEFKLELSKLGNISADDIQKLIMILSNDDQEIQNFMAFIDQKSPNSDLNIVINQLTKLGLSEYIEYNPRMVRGFDYYDGVIFEVFSKGSLDRSLFGGGRYNGLGGIFGVDDMPATGAAPGDETLKLFLEEWGLIPEDLLKPADIYFPLLADNLVIDQLKLAKKLRSQGIKVETGVQVQRIAKALDYADKVGIQRVVLLGEDELTKGVYLVREMSTGEQSTEEL